MNTTQRLLPTSLGPILALLFLSGMTFLNQQDLNRSQTNRHESLKLSHELRASSDELTRLARTYVLTGDAEYERQFWAVLNARDGQQARPDGRTVALRVLMQQQGFTANEFAKLKEAEDSSNALVNTETIAMHAIAIRCLAPNLGKIGSQLTPTPPYSVPGTEYGLFCIPQLSSPPDRSFALSVSIRMIRRESGSLISR